MLDRDRFENALEPLLALNDLQPIQIIATAVRAFAERAATFDEMDLVLLRNEAVARLNANKIGKPAQLVDTALRERRIGKRSTTSRASQGTSVPFADPDPWQDPVDGDALITELVGTVHRYVHVASEAALAVALWVLHAHCIDAAHCSPRLAIVSPTKRCGKTTLLRVLGALTPRSLPSASLTTAVLFRTIEAHHPTLLIDEADAFARENEELRGVINAGHSRGQPVLRCVGDNHEPRAFAVFGPMAIAAIGRLPETIMDRSIVIEMQRKSKDERVQSLRRPEIEALEPLCRRCARWASDNAQACGDARVAAHRELHDRAADNWEPLLAIAAVLGDEWLSRSQRAAQLLSGDHDKSEGVAEQLLSDIRDLLTGALAACDPVTTQQLLDGLVALDDRAWQDFRGGKPLNGHGLARLLRPFRITPSTIRIGRKTPKAYHRASFETAFETYLPAQSETSATAEPLGGSGDVSLVSLSAGGRERVRRVV